MKYIVAGLVGAGGLAAGMWTIVGHQRSFRVQSDAALPAIPTIEPETPDVDFYNITPTTNTIYEASAAVAHAAQEAMLTRQWASLDAPEYQNALGEQIQQVTAMYLTGSIESYEQYMVSHGFPLPAHWDNNKKQYTEDIALSFETLKLAPLNTRRVVVRPRYLNGELITYEDDQRTSIATAFRRERLPRLGTTDRALLQAYEVIVPAQVVDYQVAARSSSLGKKSSSRARFGMWFKMDRSSHQWTLMKIIIYDTPRNAAVVMPPL